MKWRLWFTLVATSGALGACGDSVTPSGDETVSTSNDALRKGSVGARVGDADYCDDSANKCALGEGDCDSSAQCQPSLTCVAGNLAKRGALSGDACAPSHCGNGFKDEDELSIDCGGSCGSDCSIACDKPNGHASRCSTDCPCSVGEGDCDSAAECQPGLVCETNSGIAFGLPAGTDACWASTCQNGAKDGNETAVDCGGSCAPCAPPAAGSVALAAGGLALLPIVIANHSDPTVHARVLAIANDLRDKLNAIVQPGGTPFAAPTVSNTPAGISLGIDGDFPNVGWPYQGFFRPNDVLAGGVLRPERLALQEQYVLRTPQGSNRVILAGATTDALQDAVWDLLKRAGYRHYFQSPTWEVTPYQPSLALTLAVDEKPAFLMRNLTFPGNQWEPAFTGTSNTQLADWAKHNRMGGNAALSANLGYGQVVLYWQNRHGTPFPAELSTDPSKNLNNRQFCLTGSKTLGGVTWTVESVIREWAAAQTTASISLSPNVNVTWASATVNGSLNCNDINDPTYSNVANRMAAILNAAADVQPAKPVTATLWYDFNEAPTLALRQNVFTNIHGYYPTPTTFALENRLKNWSDPAFEVGIEDYFGASNDETPGKVDLSPQGMLDRVHRFYQLGARRYTADANWGWGMAGPSWWTLSQVLWDADAPLSAADYRNDFLSNAFGPAAPALDKFYAVLEGRSLWSENLVGVMYRSLQQGFSLTSDPKIQARLGDLAAYTRYLELNRRFWNRCSTQTSGGTEQAELKQVLQYAYAARDRRIFESRDAMYEISTAVSACSNCTTNGCVNAQGQLTGAACVMTGWGVDCPTPTQTAGCGTVYGSAVNEMKTGTPPTLGDLSTIVVDDGVTHTHVLPDGVTHDYSLDLVPFTSDVAENNQLPTRMSELYTAQPYYLYFQRPSASGALGAHIRKYSAGQTLAGQLSLAASAGVSLGNRIFQGTALETDWTFDITSSALHRLDLDDRAGRMYTSFPLGTRVAIPAGATDPPLPFNYRWSGYFVVPAGTPSVVGWSQADGAFSRYSKATGSWQTITGYLSDYAVGSACTSPRIVVDATPANALNDHFIIPVNPPATKDEIWLFHDPTAGAGADRVLLSTPPYLFRSPAEILVPRESTAPSTVPCPFGTDASGHCVPQTTQCRGDQPCPTANPVCDDTVPCPTGMQCPATANGSRFGLPGQRVCEPPGCCSSPGEVGTATPECGLCLCKPNCSTKTCGDIDMSDGCTGRCTGVCAPGATGCAFDSDCTAGNLCRNQQCVPADVCGRADLAPPNCGPGSLCGPCPATAAASCDDRECGLDPQTGASCGSCPGTHFCNAGGHCAQKDDTPPIEVPTADGGLRPVVPDAAPAPPFLVGSTVGSFAVTDRGSSSYSVPIDVPPGRAGIEPGLAIRYTSSTGNGALGVGWSIDGFSSIARCARNYAQDGFAKPILGDSTDALCLDGQRLVSIAPNEYRTQVDSFSKIVAIGSSPSGPESFKVYTKDGRILSYGSVANARSILAGPVVGSWGLNRVADRYDNYLRIVYEQTMGTTSAGEISTAEIVPKVITYTGFGSADGDREVVFNYDTNRGDSITGYRPGGGAFARSRILRSVEIRAGGPIVRRYGLTYEESPNKAQRLTSLQECVGPTASACHRPTTFQYYDEQGFDEGIDKSIPVEFGRSVPPPFFAPVGIVHKSEDGRDLLTTLVRNATQNIVTPFPLGLSMPVSLIPTAGPIAAGFIDTINTLAAHVDEKVFYKSYTFDMMNSTSLLGSFTCDGGETAPLRQVIGNGSFGAQTLRDACAEKRVVQSGGFPPTQVQEFTPRQWLIDLDADGVQDILYCTDDSKPLFGWGPMHLDYRLAKAATTANPQPPMPGTHAQRDGEVPLWGTICDPLAKQQYSTVVDVDNDGSGNLLAYDAVAGWGALMPTGGTYAWQTAPVAGLTVDANYKYYVAAIDANGDGLRDILALPDPLGFPLTQFVNPIVAYNTGHGFKEQVLQPLRDGVASGYAGTSPRYGAYTLDIDQDGIEELVFADPLAGAQAAPWRVGRVRDGRFLNESIPSLVEGVGVLGDFDGDGDIDAFTQAVYRPPGGLPVPTPLGFRFHSGKGRRQNLLGTVNDGSGHITSVLYNDTNNLGPVYDKFPATGTCVWPQRCVARVDHPLVSNHIELHTEQLSGGSGGVDRFYEYQYKGARLDTAGYGWLGFSRRVIHVMDGEQEVLSNSTIDYKDPEPWVVGTSSVPYLYLEAGLPKSSSELGPTVSSSEISSGLGHRIAAWRTFEYTKSTSASGRPFVYMSRSDTTTSDLPSTGGSLTMVAETGTTQLDGYGNPIDEATTTSDWQNVAGVQSVEPNSTTIEHTSSDFTPTQAEISSWLVGLPKSVTVESTPRCVSTADCAAKKKARTTVFAYYPGTGQPHFVTRQSSIVSLGQVTELFRDDRGNVTRTLTTDAYDDVRESRTAYDSRHLFPISVSAFGDGKELKTQIRIDNRFGTLSARADANGIDETWTRDDFGVGRSYSGPGGTSSTDYQTGAFFETPDGFEVPSMLRVTSRKVGGEETTTELNSFGQVVSRKSRGLNGAEVFEEFGYDFRHRLIVSRRPHLAGDTSQGVVQYSYDELDRVVTEDLPDPGTQIKHDYANAVTLSSDPNLHLQSWNVGGARTFVQTTDPRGNKTLGAYDRDGQPVVIVDAEQKPTKYEYAAFGDLARIIDPLQRAIELEHDDYGRLTSVTDAARGGTEYTYYNGLDEVVASNDAAGRTQTVHYDDFGRVETLEDHDGTSTYVYDGPNDNELGRLVEVTSAFGQRQVLGYEPRTNDRNRGLLVQTTSELLPVNAPANAQPRQLTTHYYFDDDARLQQVDYPSIAGNPLAVKYEFDTYGHTTKIRNAAVPSQVYWELVSADQGYRIHEERIGSHACGSGQGNLTTRSYEPLTGRTQSIKTQCGSQVLQDLTYGYDHSGNLTSRFKSGAFEGYDYDALNRLTKVYPAVGVPPVTRYAYDPDGQGRMVSQAGVGSYTYETNQGRDWIHSAGSTTYTHDLVGNITNRSGPGVPGGSQQIDYTALDLPSKITSGSNETNFAYDAQGSRVVKQSPTATTYYAGDSFQLTETATNTSQRFMIYAGGRAVAQLTNTTQGGTTSPDTVRYLHDDLLGSTDVVSDASGAIATTLNYDHFGQQTSSQTETPYGFTGQETDADLGLINMRGRMYDPVLGQFLSADPILSQPYSQGLNRFAYVNNSPLNFTDPSGFSARPRRRGNQDSAMGARAMGGGGGGAELSGRGGIGGMAIVGGAALAGLGGAGLYALAAGSGSGVAPAGAAAT